MGSLQQSGDLTMDGVVTVTGSYTENSTGILTYDLNSNSFNRSHQLAIDNFTVDGNAALNGTLDINFEQGFLPTLSTGTFTILTFGSDPGSSNFLNLEYSINGIYQGTFNPGSDSSFGNGFTFKEINTGSAIELEVVTATPEPSTWLMLAAGLLALGALELRRRNAVLRVQYRFGLSPMEEDSLDSKPVSRLPLIAIVLGFLLVAAGLTLYGISLFSKGSVAITTPYQAVLLTNGSAYFGKLEGLGTPYPVLKEVFYVQSVQNPETKQVSNILVKRGKEWHSPDRMILNANMIVLVEPVNPNSRVAQLIAEAKN